jgi:hypothetical protein
MKTPKTVKVVSYVNCMRVDYCEVPIVGLSRRKLPLVHSSNYPGYSINAINILDDTYTYVWLKSNTPHTSVICDVEKSNVYNDCIGYYKRVSLNCNTIDIGVTRTCGCKGRECRQLSGVLYAILVINARHVEVLQIDRLPLYVYMNDPKWCPAKFLLEQLHWTCVKVLGECRAEYFRMLFEGRYGYEGLDRMCNARFLKYVPFRDFKKTIRQELQRQDVEDI